MTGRPRDGLRSGRRFSAKRPRSRSRREKLRPPIQCFGFVCQVSPFVLRITRGGTFSVDVGRDVEDVASATPAGSGTQLEDKFEANWKSGSRCRELSSETDLTGGANFVQAQRERIARNSPFAKFVSTKQRRLGLLRGVVVLPTETRALNPLRRRALSRNSLRVKQRRDRALF